MSQFHSRRRRYERVTRLAELSGREEEETQRERQRNCRNIRKNERERGRLAAGCRMQRCPEYDGKQRLSNFTKPDAQSTGGERRARARQSLGRVPSVRAAGGEDATRRRRLSREGRTEKHRERSRRRRGGERLRLRGKKSTSAPHQKYDPNPSEINHLRMKICFILKDSPEDSFHLRPAALSHCFNPGTNKGCHHRRPRSTFGRKKSAGEIRGARQRYPSSRSGIFLVSPSRHHNAEEEPWKKEHIEREFG